MRAQFLDSFFAIQINCFYCLFFYCAFNIAYLLSFLFEFFMNFHYKQKKPISFIKTIFYYNNNINILIYILILYIYFLINLEIMEMKYLKNNH